MRTAMLAGGTFAALAVAVFPAPAPASAGDRQDVRSRLTTVRPGTATGISLETRFFDPGSPEGKPYSLDKLVIQSRLQLDQEALPRCSASDAELMARGEAACPVATKVQSGSILLDTGSPLLVPRLMRFRTTTFNADRGFVSLGEADSVFLRGVVRSEVSGDTVTVDYVDAPGWGGPDSQSAMRTMVSAGPPLIRNGRVFMRTPERCPRSRRWTARYTFVYHDGARQTEQTHAPCRPKRRHR